MALKNINITRALAFFDIETTGTNITKDRIVQIAIIRVEPDGTTKTFKSLVNPERPIPIETADYNHIYDDDVKDAPIFKKYLF